MPSRLEADGTADIRKNLLIMGITLLTVLIAIGVVYGILAGLGAAKAKQREDILAQVNQTETDIKKEEPVVKELLKYGLAVQVVGETLNQHIYLTKLFKTIEQHTQPGVTYGNFAVDVQKGQMTMDALAPSYSAAVTQILAYRQIPMVTGVGTSSASASIGETGQIKGVGFSLPVTFKKELLQIGQDEQLPAKPFTLEDCGTIQSLADAGGCFGTQFAACSPARVIYQASADESLRLEIRGLVQQKCQVDVRYVQIKNQGLVGQEAVCSFDQTGRLADQLASAQSAKSCSGAEIVLPTSQPAAGVTP